MAVERFAKYLGNLTKQDKKKKRKFHLPRIEKNLPRISLKNDFCYRTKRKKTDPRHKYYNPFRVFS